MTHPYSPALGFLGCRYCGKQVSEHANPGPGDARRPDPTSESVPVLTEPTMTVGDDMKAYCAHISGIEHVKVTQARGSVYEWWRCMSCRTEFRPTGSPAHGEASNREDRS